MNLIKRKNSFWQLYGILVIVWGIYAFSILIGNNTINLIQISVLTTFSLLILISQWSNTVEIVFSVDFLVVRHLLKSKSKKYYYSDIKSVEYIFTRIYGRRLIFKCSEGGKLPTGFTIYNPDHELIEFISSHIKTYKNKIG